MVHGYAGYFTTRNIPGMFLRVGLILVALYFFFRWFERSNIWMPRRDFFATPEAAGLVYEDVEFKTADDVRLHGWYLPHAKAKAALLFCHGNAGNVSHRTESLRQWHALSLNVFIFDYRGYGRSEGRPSEEGTYLDAQAAYDWLQGRCPELPIILFGRSLGAAVAIDLAARGKGAALIAESGFTSVPAIGQELFPILPVKWLVRTQYNSVAKIQQVRIPVLVIHSREDEIVPFHHGETLFEAAPGPKQFLEIRGGHNDGYVVSETEYLRGIQAFLDAYVKKGGVSP